MGKSKLLFITHEMSPFLDLTKISEITRQLPQAMQDKGLEIRILMPRFGNINERRNRLHEVIRLSGMNIIINDNDNPLIIKVASIPSARMQVYFLDNEEYYKIRVKRHLDKKTISKVPNEENAFAMCINFGDKKIKCGIIIVRPEFKNNLFDKFQLTYFQMDDQKVEDYRRAALALFLTNYGTPLVLKEKGANNFYWVYGDNYLSLTGKNDNMVITIGKIKS